MTNLASEATNSDVENLINSEIADFFAGIGQPGEPETPQEMQQQLQSRISAIFNAAPNGMMQLSNELAEMKRSKFTVKLPAPRISYGGIEVYHPHIVIEAIKNAGGTVERSE